ncbi:hypothetical protein [Prauserella endophytica]|nr:hypothetical protein [Prauserella endophytica]
MVPPADPAGVAYPTRPAHLDDYPVRVSSVLLGELKGIPEIFCAS